MSAIRIRNLSVGFVCAGLMASAGFASADRYSHHFGGREYVGHSTYRPRFGVGVVIGGPAYYADPYYVDPYYAAPAYVGPSVVIGGYWGGGYYGHGYYRGGYHGSYGRGFGGHRH